MISYTYKNPLFGYQQKIWNGFMLDPTIRKAVINASRQVGKTTLGKRMSVHWVINDPGCHIGWIAPESKNFLHVFNWMAKSLSDIIIRVDSKKNYIEFKNGSMISFFSIENHEAIRGQAFTYRIADEFSFGRFGQQEAIASYDPTIIAKGKKEIIFSTPKAKNHHYRAYMAALDDPRAFTFECKTEENPLVDKTWLAEKKRQLPPTIYQQEYEGKFIDSGGSVFTHFDKVCTINHYSLPDRREIHYVGIDWGSRNDQSVLTILNSKNEVVEIVSSYLQDYPSIINHFIKTLEKYKIGLGYAETNGVGQAGYDYLRQAYPMIEGFTMSNRSKQDLVQLLRSKIEHKLVSLPTEELSPELYRELGNYQVSVTESGLYKYSHAPGAHDDYIDSLMFAVKAAHTTQPLEINTRHHEYDLEDALWGDLD